MTGDDDQATNRSEARLDFAERLRALRIPRGFRTARSFAKALGIDENRYTRYERAEVEPDLGLIRRICEILHVSPADLLQTPHAKPMPDGEASDLGHAPLIPTSAISAEHAAWALSGLVACARRRATRDTSSQAPDAVGFKAEASAVLEAILASPAAVVERLRDDAAIRSYGGQRDVEALLDRVKKLSRPN